MPSKLVDPKTFNLTVRLVQSFFTSFTFCNSSRAPYSGAAPLVYRPVHPLPSPLRGHPAGHGMLRFESLLRLPSAKGTKTRDQVLAISGRSTGPSKSRGRFVAIRLTAQFVLLGLVK